jgi:hypothetical protein
MLARPSRVLLVDTPEGTLAAALELQVPASVS